MCVPGLAAYLRAAAVGTYDAEPAELAEAAEAAEPAELTDAGPAGSTGPVDDDRPLVSATGTTATKGRA